MGVPNFQYAEGLENFKNFYYCGHLIALLWGYLEGKFENPRFSIKK